MADNAQHVGILGSGAMGMALAVVAAEAGSRVTVWTLEDPIAEAINTTQRHPTLYQDVLLPETISATTRLEDLEETDALVLVVPAQHIREVTTRLTQAFPVTQGLIVAAKGIEQGTGLLMTEVIAEVQPGLAMGVLSGPNFAAEMIVGAPTASLFASTSEPLTRQALAIFNAPFFRLYTSTDVVGAQIGGAFKNVLAIVSGIVAGLGLGHNAQALVVTRGLAEMIRFGQARGATAQTFQGLSGVGDLCLTAYGPLSRNFTFGKALGEGYTVEEARRTLSDLTEGYYTCASLVASADAMGLELPLTQALYRILYEKASLGEVQKALTSRPQRAE